jgi:hypothetical protein
MNTNPNPDEASGSSPRDNPCYGGEGQKLVVEFDLMEPNTFDAKNGVIIRAGSVLPLE